MMGTVLSTVEITENPRQLVRSLLVLQHEAQLM